VNGRLLLPRFKRKRQNYSRDGMLREYNVQNVTELVMSRKCRVPIIRTLHVKMIWGTAITCDELELFTDFFSFIPVTATRDHPYRLFVSKNSTRENFLHIVLLNLGITCPLMLLILVH